MPASRQTCPLYFVEVDLGPLGATFREADRDRMSRRKVVDDIVSGELENVLKVLEIREDENACHDITADIARAVADQFHQSRAPLTWELAGFLQHHLGVTATRALNFERAAE